MRITRKIHNLLHPKLGKILMLHSVGSTELLESLVSQCRQEGYEFVSLDEAAKRFKEREGRRFACFTFDDGYLDTYTVAYPFLKGQGIPFCVYMTRDFYRGTARPSWSPEVEMMGVAHLVDMASDPLCTIGVHTCSHPWLSQLPVEVQRGEMADCKADLEGLLGVEIRHLAYPYGDYDQQTLAIVAELGFLTATTVSGRFVRDDAKLLELDRVIVN